MRLSLRRRKWVEKMSEGNLYYWVANWNLSRAQAARLLGNEVSNMIDCLHGSVPTVAKSSATVYAGYITGTPDIRWTADDFREVDRLHPGAIILRIDQSNNDSPEFSDIHFAVKDDEAGASSVSESIRVAHERIMQGDDYVIYCSQAVLTEVEDAASAANLPHGSIIAYQYASPTSNPATLLPGTSITLREANADLSVIETAWLRKPAPAPKPAPDPRPYAALVSFDPATEKLSLGATARLSS